jgi:hypothetical protein
LQNSFKDERCQTLFNDLLSIRQAEVDAALVKEVAGKENTKDED